ncbi:family 20 glycosylhydrolase [candidate division KSB1 bacterium]|nr:family 20 glycosylhydrolase [candidate division KSB1 bacterium]
MFAFLLVFFSLTIAQTPPDSLMPVRGFCIAAPRRDNLNRFIDFMKKELAPNGINTLVLRVDYNYAYESYPNLRDEEPLSKKQVKKLVRVAQKHNIQLIPQINLLGHQSWAETIHNLLREYPQFDETPHIKMPEKYKWPNDDGLYCKSYCPLHPEVHDVVFALVDEIIKVFEAKAFHAGMDEVFYIGENNCPRCSGKDKAELFAGEVTKIRDFLAADSLELWIWGDRLLDGSTTGLGMWEASENYTFSAIDKIPNDVVICDWHYERAESTPAFFAVKGFRVIACPWNNPQVTGAQLEMMHRYRQNSNSVLQGRFLGVMQTVWSSAETFMDAYYSETVNERAAGQVNSFKTIVDYFKTGE